MEVNITPSVICQHNKNPGSPGDSALLQSPASGSETLAACWVVLWLLDDLAQDGAWDYVPILTLSALLLDRSKILPARFYEGPAGRKPVRAWILELTADAEKSQSQRRDIR